MTAIFERVAARANDGGLPITAEAVREIDQLLMEERLRSLPSLKTVADAKPVGGDDGDESAGDLGSSHGIARHDGSAITP